MALDGYSRDRPRAKVLPRVVAVSAVAVLAIGGLIGWKLIPAGLPTSVPSCAWSLRVRGHATSEQAGLIRCYLRAIAQHDTNGLLAVAYTTNGPVRITARDFRHSADARAGIATATLGPVGDDYSYAVTIVFADHARDTVAMGPANPASLHSWRLGIGTLAVHDSGPPPTKRCP